MSKYLVIRLAILIALAAVAFMVAFSGDEDGIRTPLVTMLGGLIVFVAALPERRPTPRELGITFGTGVIVLGSYFWLLDATPDEFESPLVIMLVYIVIAFAILAWILIWLVVLFWEVILKRSKSSGE